MRIAIALVFAGMLAMPAHAQISIALRPTTEESFRKFCINNAGSIPLPSQPHCAEALKEPVDAEASKPEPTLLDKSRRIPQPCCALPPANESQQITVQTVNGGPYAPGQANLIKAKLDSFQDECQKSESSVDAALMCMRDKAMAADAKGEFGPGVKVLVITTRPK